jgi:hypothetical protein
MELEAARRLIPVRTSLVAIDGAGHGLGKSPKASRPSPETIARIVDAFLAFVEDAKVTGEGENGGKKLRPSAARLDRVSLRANA